MKSLSKNAFRSRQMRGMAVAMAIAGAAAAVAAGVVMAEPQERDRLLPPSASAELIWGSGALRPELRAQTRSATDAGRLIAAPRVRRSGLASSRDQADVGDTMPTDASVPDAAEALKDAAGPATETAATF